MFQKFTLNVRNLKIIIHSINSVGSTMKKEKKFAGCFCLEGIFHRCNILGMASFSIAPAERKREYNTPHYT
jgi:hypothetical protein